MRISILCLLAISFFATACSTHKPNLEAEQQATEATVNWFYEQYGVLNNRELNSFVNRVTKRLAGGLAVRKLDDQVDDVTLATYRDYPWQVYLLNTQEINAFSIGAGVVILTGGLLEQVTSEAELASIISHEMAHQILGHTRRALESLETTESSEEPTSNPVFAFSQEDEVDADTFAMKLMGIVHYDPTHAISALTISNRQSGEFVSSIPEDWYAIRVSNMKKTLEIIGNYLPATQSTREFVRIKRLLSSAHLSPPKG